MPLVYGVVWCGVAWCGAVGCVVLRTGFGGPTNCFHQITRELTLQCLFILLFNNCKYCHYIIVIFRVYIINLAQQVQRMQRITAFSGNVKLCNIMNLDFCLNFPKFPKGKFPKYHLFRLKWTLFTNVVRNVLIVSLI